MKDRLILCARNDLLRGDFLIDDRLANGAGEFGTHDGHGELLLFGSERFPTWAHVLFYLGLNPDSARED